jgi:hypothetical protein
MIKKIFKKIKRNFEISRLKDQLVYYKEKYDYALRNYDTEAMQECNNYISTIEKKIESVKSELVEL